MVTTGYGFAARLQAIDYSFWNNWSCSAAEMESVPSVAEPFLANATSSPETARARRPLTVKPGRISAGAGRVEVAVFDPKAYRDGSIKKPERCAFNDDLCVCPDGKTRTLVEHLQKLGTYQSSTNNGSAAARTLVTGSTLSTGDESASMAEPDAEDRPGLGDADMLSLTSSTEPADTKRRKTSQGTPPSRNDSGFFEDPNISDLQISGRDAFSSAVSFAPSEVKRKRSPTPTTEFLMQDAASVIHLHLPVITVTKDGASPRARLSACPPREVISQSRLNHATKFDNHTATYLNHRAIDDDLLQLTVLTAAIDQIYSVTFFKDGLHTTLRRLVCERDGCDKIMPRERVRPRKQVVLCSGCVRGVYGFGSAVNQSVLPAVKLEFFSWFGSTDGNI